MIQRPIGNAGASTRRIEGGVQVVMEPRDGGQPAGHDGVCLFCAFCEAPNLLGRFEGCTWGRQTRQLARPWGIWRHEGDPEATFGRCTALASEYPFKSAQFRLCRDSQGVGGLGQIENEMLAGDVGMKMDVTTREQDRARQGKTGGTGVLCTQSPWVSRLPCPVIGWHLSV